LNDGAELAVSDVLRELS